MSRPGRLSRAAGDDCREGLDVVVRCGGLAGFAVHLGGVAPAIGCIRSANTAVIAKQRLLEGLRASEILGEHCHAVADVRLDVEEVRDRKSTRLNSSHLVSSYALFCLKHK